MACVLANSMEKSLLFVILNFIYTRKKPLNCFLKIDCSFQIENNDHATLNETKYTLNFITFLYPFLLYLTIHQFVFQQKVLASNFKETNRLPLEYNYLEHCLTPMAFKSFRFRRLNARYDLDLLEVDTA